MKRFKIALGLAFCAITYNIAVALSDNISIFPLQNYSQSVAHWLPESSSDYNTPLLSKQEQNLRFKDLKSRYFGYGDNDYSPWSGKYVNFVLQEHAEKSIYEGEQTNIANFNNQGKGESDIGYGMNYRPYSAKWINSITQNMNLAQLQGKLSYNKNKRAILVDNVAVRALPTSDPFFYSYKIAGNGYPFDMLQSTSLFIGTPVYVIATSVDKQWQLILSPEVIGWVKANSVAFVSSDFIESWSNAANSNLGAITQTNTSIIDNNGNYRLTTYIGTMLPLYAKNSSKQIIIPVKNSKGNAEIIPATVLGDAVAKMPLVATSANFAKLLNQLVGRPYGWGGLEFFNDCSAELKDIYATFGIFLPRNSGQQIMVGKVVDISSKSLDERITYLNKNGRKLMTLVRIPGHVMLYIGAFQSENAIVVPVVYNNLWALSPSDRSRRAVLGGGVFLPLLAQYPEDLELTSPLSRPVVQLVYLDQMPESAIKLGLDQLLY